jgi:uncharacterized damage-inducible protein DinB
VGTAQGTNDDVFPGIKVTPIWSRLNDGLIELVERVPNDKMDWTPKAGLWSFRDILLHLPSGRDVWLSRDVKDGIETPDLNTVRNNVEIQGAYHRTWERLQPFLMDVNKLDATYPTRRGSKSGHWIAFHLLEHEIHHRSEILHYLAMLDISTPDVGTP